MIDAKRIAEIRERSATRAETEALCDYALAAMEAEGHMLNLIVDTDALWGSMVSQHSKQAKAALARLRAARGVK